MSEFKARLRMPPKRAYWLGCVVSSLEARVSRVHGRPYVVVRFENCPFIYTLGAYMADQYRLAMMERGLAGQILEVGDVVHMDVRWVEGPNSTPKNPVWYPRVDVDFGALLDERSRMAKLTQEGRA